MREGSGTAPVYLPVRAVLYVDSSDPMAIAHLERQNSRRNGRSQSFLRAIYRIAGVVLARAGKRGCCFFPAVFSVRAVANSVNTPTQCGALSKVGKNGSTYKTVEYTQTLKFKEDSRGTQEDDKRNGNGTCHHKIIALCS